MSKCVCIYHAPEVHGPKGCTVCKEKGDHCPWDGTKVKQRDEDLLAVDFKGHDQRPKKPRYNFTSYNVDVWWSWPQIKKLLKHKTVRKFTHGVLICPRVPCHRFFRYAYGLPQYPRCECGYDSLVWYEDWAPANIFRGPVTEFTILYLSGTPFRIENYLRKHPERLGHLGVLLSYIDLRQRGGTWKRLVALKTPLKLRAIEGVCEGCGVNVNWDPKSMRPAPQCPHCGFIACLDCLKPHKRRCKE